MKKFWIVVCVVGVVVFLGYIGKDMDLSNIGGNNTNTASSQNVITAKNKTVNNNTQNTANKTNNTNNSNTNNNTVETKNETQNTVNTTENTTNNVSNTTTENTTNQTTENNTNTIEVVSISDEDKAKELAKKAYGSTDGVYFKVEQVESNGIYIISVRDVETTSALAWYNVNVKTGSVN